MEVQAHEPSSSSSSTVSTNYEVFLSCSGKRTRTTFISRLYRELVKAGIRTFMDDEESKKGEEIAPNLLRAIAESRIFIPIFSTSYASSKWCLNELVQIMEFRDTMGKTVLPIFYHVNPRDVQNQIEGFGQQFHQLANCSDKGTVERWKKTLGDAGELKGLDLKDVENGNESKLIQKVLRSVWSELCQSSFDVAENLVGIDSCVRLLTLLNGESKDVRFVGIWGMGGIGKTTIAEAVFGRIRQNFEGSIFLEDVREASKLPDGLVCLQQILLSDVLKQEIQFISNVNEGKSLIKKCLHSKKVIIFLDDVDKIEQLKTLAGGPDWFGPGSRIVITTRDKHVLLEHKVHEIYEPKELDFDQSLQLLCKHAFGKDQPPDDFMKLAEDVVLAIGGLPLGLKVLGSFLSDKSSPTVWKSTLHRLRKIPHKDVQEKLKISYDELEDSDKEIFLDIACFFIGMDKEYAIDICEGRHFLASSGIINLIQKSLVKIDNYNKLRMHDQLRDMGRHIVRQEDPNEPGKRSRLWSHEEVLNVLEEREGTRNVKGIICKLEGKESALEEIRVRTEAFEMMSQLRLLQIDNVHLEGDFKRLPSELRWLSWKGCPLQSITDFHLEKLAVLDLSYSRIRRFLTDLNRDKQFRGLKVLDLSYCRYLIKTPNFLGLPNLEKLNLEGCIKLEALPRSICNLISLKKLILSGCSNLNKLPDLRGSLNQLEVLQFEDCKLLCRLPDLIGSMRNLKSLSLDGTIITELPEAIGSLEKIEVLTVRHCKKLVKLPDSMGEMRLLRRFEIDETGIVKFPEDFGKLSRLEVLRMPGCLKFRGFPEIFGSLSVFFSGLCSLTSLDVSDCNLSERGIPSDFGNLYSLEKLSLSFNNFGRLPDSIGALSRLQSLEIVNCRTLQSLPELPSSLCSLDLNNCTSMERLPDLSNLRKLHRLDLRNCTELAEIQGMKKMESLEELWMSGCSRYLVDSMKKSLGRLLLQHLRLCSFPGSKIPFWFTPTVTKAIVWSDREHEIRLECEIPTRLWNPEKHHKIISLVLCFVFTNQSEILEISPMTLKVQVKRNGGHIYSNSGHPFVIFSKRHQDQICLYQFRDWLDNDVTEYDDMGYVLSRLETDSNMSNSEEATHGPCGSQKHDGQLPALDNDISHLTNLRSAPSEIIHKFAASRKNLPISTVKMLAAREANYSGQGRFSRAECSHVLSRYLPVNGPRLVDNMSSRAYISQFSADGTLFVAGFQDHHIRIYDVDHGWRVHKDILAKNLRWTITDTSLSPDQRYLVYASISPIVHIVNVGAGPSESHANITDIHEGLIFATDENVLQSFGIFSIKFSTDGRELVAGCSDDALYVYDLEANKVTLRIPAHSSDVNTVSFADETGHLIYSGSDDSLCKVWDRRCFNANGRPAGILEGHLQGITFLDSRGDGRYFISNGKDQTTKLWDIRKMSSKPSSCRARRVYDEWDYRWNEYPSSARNFKHPNDQSVATYKGHSVLKTLIRCYFSPASSTGQKYIYTGSHDNCVYIYDVVSGDIVAKLDYHEATVRDCSWHPLYPMLVTSSWDGVIASWEFPGMDKASAVGRKKSRRRHAY